MASLVIASDWIVPVESPAIRGGFLVVQDGRIVQVSDKRPDHYRDHLCVRLVGGAILPGLINSHCHLELSDFAPRLDVPGTGTYVGSMVGWLDQLMARKKSIAHSGIDIEERKRKAIWLGLEESCRLGTRWVIDNVTAPWSAHWCEAWQANFCNTPKSQQLAALVPHSPLLVQPCMELVDVTQTRHQQTWGFAQQHLSNLRASSRLGPRGVVQGPMGLAPHAPYTASKRLVEQAVQSANASGAILSMHLAESLEELDYADCSRGPFKEWISPWIDQEHAQALGSIDEHLRLLTQAKKAILAHGNYLSDRQIESLHCNRDHVAVAYCPRTHQHFRHLEHPARRLAASRVPLLLGTDSRASNPDLSVFEEWRLACNLFPDLGPKFWMAACTTVPANFWD